MHGTTLGQLSHCFAYRNTWQAVGREIGRLHRDVKECSDPNRWLDLQAREYTPDDVIYAMSSTNLYHSNFIATLEHACASLTDQYTGCFLHGDVHENNIMCTTRDEFLAILDWGDAGWGDPSLEFYMIPLEAILPVLRGYSQICASNITTCFLTHIILDKIWEQRINNAFTARMVEQIEKLHEVVLSIYN